MQTFFDGWRRKVGCITLAMALALLGLWSRSLWTVDVMSVLELDLQSANGHLIWFTDLGDEDAVYWLTYSFDPDWHVIRPGSPIVEWQFQVTGFGMGGVTMSNDVGWMGTDLSGRYRMPKTNDFTYLWIISYWYLIVPPTILSAYLILMKPRQAPKPAEL